MRPLVTLGALLVLGALVGCEKLRIRDVDPSALVVEAAELSRRAEAGDSKNVTNIHELPKDQWPESIRRTHPKAVRYSSRGVWLLDFKWASKENGVFIPAPGYPWPVDSPEVAPGVYKYASE
jgi:hypothetical protein